MPDPADSLQVDQRALRSAMKARGVTPRQLRTLADLGKGAWRSAFWGGVASSETLADLALVLGVPLSDLVASPSPAATAATAPTDEIVLNAAAVRRRMASLNLEPWQVSVRSGCQVGGSCLRRALNGKPIQRAKGEALAHVFRCEVSQIMANGEPK